MNSRILVNDVDVPQKNRDQTNDNSANGNWNGLKKAEMIDVRKDYQTIKHITSKKMGKHPLLSNGSWAILMILT